LELWADSNRLKRLDDYSDSWLCDAGFRTLSHWDRHPEDVAVAWCPKAVESYVFRELSADISPGLQWLGSARFRFEYRHWNPVKKERVAYVNSVQKSFSGSLEAYLARIERLISQGGLEAPKKKHKEKYKKMERQHLYWLVCYQFLGWSFKRISREEENTADSAHPDTISNAVNSMAELLIGPNFNVWLRPPSRAGRPRTDLRPQRRVEHDDAE
jgi:hypothetical protein